MQKMVDLIQQDTGCHKQGTKDHEDQALEGGEATGMHAYWGL
jgi:hypothetical protein